MKDLITSILENNMKLEIPIEYAEYLKINPGEIPYHDPENEEQAAIARKVKMKTASWLVICSILLWALLAYVIVSKNKPIVIALMGFMAVAFTIASASVVLKKLQVATGRAVIKMKKPSPGKKNSYSYTVAVAVDEPEKAIYSGISVSKKDYKKIQGGMPIMIVNVSSGKGVVLD